MNILVGEGTLFSNSGSRSVFSSGSFHSANRPSSVEKVNKADPVNSYKESAISQAEKSMISGTPAATVSISGLGKAALLALNRMTSDSKANTSVNENTVSDDNIYKSVGIYEDSSNVSSVANAHDDDGSESQSSSLSSDGTVNESSSNSIQNLGLYTEVQLKNLVNSGDITRTEMNDELAKRELAEQLTSVQASNNNPVNDPVMKQAIAAYNFQMSYQIHAAVAN